MLSELCRHGTARSRLRLSENALGWWCVPLTEILLECPSIGDSHRNKFGQVIDGVRPRGSFGTIVKEFSARNCCDVSVGAHCPSGCSLLDKRSEFSRNRHIQTGLLLDDSNGSIQRSFALLAGITRKGCGGVNRCTKWMNQYDVAVSGLDHDKCTVIIKIGVPNRHDFNLERQCGFSSKTFTKARGVL
jgi:hypothetical protein